jgi:hypothetical protein
VSELARIDGRLSQVVELLRCLVSEVRMTRGVLEAIEQRRAGDDSDRSEGVVGGVRVGDAGAGDREVPALGGGLGTGTGARAGAAEELGRSGCVEAGVRGAAAGAAAATGPAAGVAGGTGLRDFRKGG